MKITDLTPYRQHVDQFDLTEEQKLEWVNAVYTFVEGLFNKEFGPEIVQPNKRWHSKPESNS